MSPPNSDFGELKGSTLSTNRGKRYTRVKYIDHSEILSDWYVPLKMQVSVTAVGVMFSLLLLNLTRFT